MNFFYKLTLFLSIPFLITGCLSTNLEKHNSMTLFYEDQGMSSQDIKNMKRIAIDRDELNKNTPKGKSLLNLNINVLGKNINNELTNTEKTKTIKHKIKLIDLDIEELEIRNKITMDRQARKIQNMRIKELKETKYKLKKSL